MPHCVTCSITCPPYDPAVKSIIANPARLVCGVDGNTYRNLCEIKRTACMLGRSIPVAYRGACTGNLCFFIHSKKNSLFLQFENQCTRLCQFYFVFNHYVDHFKNEVACTRHTFYCFLHLIKNNQMFV